MKRPVIPALYRLNRPAYSGSETPHPSLLLYSYTFGLSYGIDELRVQIEVSQSIRNKRKEDLGGFTVLASYDT